MSYSRLSKTIAFYFGVLVMTFLVGYLVFAWTEPQQAPPGCTAGQPGCDAPLNVGPTGQSKSGGLILNTGGAATGLIVDKGKVGIGTTSPLGKVHINFGTPGVDYFRITNDVNTIAVLGDNTTPNDRGMLSLYYNGAITTHISATDSYFNGGRVGIGTTTPGTTLDVNGALRLRPSSAPTGANGIVYYDSTTNKFRCYENGAWVDCIGAAAAGYWTQSGSSLYPNNTAWNVGIGTTSPGYKLDVAGSANIINPIYLGTQGSWGSAFIHSRDFPFQINDLQRGRPLFYRDWSASDGDFLRLNNVQSGGVSLDDRITLSDVKGFVVDTNGIERMRIDPNGNVGIGTTSPSLKLDVRGGLTIGGHWASDQFISFEDWNPGFHRIVFNNLRFYEGEYGDMVTFDNGKVGIGTTGPVYKLQVAGDIGSTGDLVLYARTKDFHDIWFRTGTSTLYTDELYLDSSTNIWDFKGNTIKNTAGVYIDSWDSQLRTGYTGGGTGGRRSIGGAHGWDANTLYINGWNDWSSGVSVGSSSGTSKLTVSGNLTVDGGFKVSGLPEFCTYGRSGTDAGTSYFLTTYCASWATTTQAFCTIKGISGNWAGSGESCAIFESAGNWYLFYKSGQSSLGCSVGCVRIFKP